MDSSLEKSDLPEDVLIVTSKLKNYIKARGGLNTSGNVASRLSEILREICDEAILKAKASDRKTLMDRDFQ